MHIVRGTWQAWVRVKVSGLVPMDSVTEALGILKTPAREQVLQRIEQILGAGWINPTSALPRTTGAVRSKLSSDGASPFKGRREACARETAFVHPGSDRTTDLLKQEAEAQVAQQ